MQHPREDDRSAPDGAAIAELSPFRPYLLMLARLQFNDALQAKLDASDLVQQTLLEAQKSLSGFRGTSEREKAAWLRRILARNLADELRRFHRNKRDLHLEESLQAYMSDSTARLEKWLASEEGSPSECAIANEQLMALAEAVMLLPEDQRSAVELHHLQGYPSAVVAVRLGRTEIAIAGLLRRGLKRLRELMRNEDVR